MRGIRGTRGMFTRIPGNLLEDSGECYYFKIPRNVKEVPGNVQEDSGECSIRFWGVFKKIQRNVQEDSGECSKRFREMCKKIPGNVRKNFGECLRRFWGMLEKIPENAGEDSGESNFRFILWNLVYFSSNFAINLRQKKRMFSTLLLTAYN